MNFSDQNILHVIVFNLYRDEVLDDDIYQELREDKTNLETFNLDNYLEVFYVSRFRDRINDLSTST